MDQNLFADICPQGAAVLLRHRAQGAVGHGAQKRLPRRPVDGLGLGQILDDGPRTREIERIADGVDDVHQQRLAVDPDPGDADISVAAAPALYDVAPLR